MTCFGCHRERAVMWSYTIKVGRTVVTRSFCNLCELEYLRAA